MSDINNIDKETNENLKNEEVNETLKDKQNADSSEILEDEQKLEDEEFEELQEDASSKDKELEEMKILNSKLKDENEKLKNELDTVKERLLRTVAEYENYRNRTAKEKEGIYSDACADVLKDILPALDNMERASSIDGSVEDLKKGIEMTVRQFKDSLTKLGVEEIDSSGEFDPNVHNAVMHIEDESLGENSIAEVLQKGYKKADKVIRYSMVKVAN
ncbi:protein GrpE [Clostridium pasteurianum DSM 525 = ATCC 6013]|uniref:Protein GrpE n=1 Tax=Clostridium pasteurianum DSM 525 = ATCC 6013 TaxID=1262449 RepID=A0A0H3J8S8_CLOPA|nr:nucleotide exchange factor GrpE [Clostridium pasteurianum]AJA48383.1 protein GrpE [Clostridium pasteurianum DSM 525 = ATCC 6013]AJA52371.1 protein GrpE [Clostridium pasteurianum DSM 525 = ATCC 6013]AOZ75629.1 molecular chaperone GrpE [Clostridium pasteurianum DSM 525 = ATCC 6013]AOZ79425.1 molecular chaperone GrpE [Clostridium pasteurianum]ELP60467.1 heat shock protein GrpE [Clostridium pasteurianum DSM 525 = ATCC 6013]